MEVTALCTTLLINVLVLLLPAHVHHSHSQRFDATFPHFVPSRLQFFEYETIVINCGGFFNDITGWRVLRKIKGTETICNSKWEIKETCNITTAFSTDSGEYWCEADGKKSGTVSIVVTAGPVILESPALPLTEGEAVILSCRNEMTSSNLTADIYKDGLLLSSTGKVIIHSVSKTDEGLYKCNISDLGESPESWLAVRAGSVVLETPDPPVRERDSVTLSCRNNNNYHHQASFYKDGLLLGNSSTGEMIIHSVSRSDEGFYKCIIYGVGESAESRLTVTALHPFSHSSRVSILLWMVVTVFFVLLLLLLGVGLLHMKFKGVSTSSPSLEGPRTVRNTDHESAEASDLSRATYAVIKFKKEKAAELQPREAKDKNEPLTSVTYYTLGMGSCAFTSTAGQVPSEETNTALTEEARFYDPAS